MRYVVDAGFCDGKPRLRVLDADSGEVRVQWLLEKSSPHSPGELSGKQAAHPGEIHNMQSLLKSLFLIACSDDLDHLRDINHTDAGSGSPPSSNGETGH